MQKANKLRIVIDTNLLISALIVSGSTPDRLLQAWRKDSFILVTSEQLLEEISEVAKRNSLNKYCLFPKRVDKLLEGLSLSTELVMALPEQNLPIRCRDPKDNKILACALGGKADYLVTGDKDLLTLNGNPALSGLKIILAKEFLDILGS